MFRLIGIVVVIIVIIALLGFDVTDVWENFLQPAFIFLWHTLETIFLFIINFVVKLIDLIA